MVLIWLLNWRFDDDEGEIHDDCVLNSLLIWLIKFINIISFDPVLISATFVVCNLWPTDIGTLTQLESKIFFAYFIPFEFVLEYYFWISILLDDGICFEINVLTSNFILFIDNPNCPSPCHPLLHIWFRTFRAHLCKENRQTCWLVIFFQVC